MMDLTIIIPVCDDLRIERCIKSIDEDVEIIVSMNNPTEKIKKLINRLGVDSCQIAKQSLSKAYNEGIKKSTKNHILITDSDCVFKKGSIQKLYSKINRYEIVKGKIIFRHNSFMSKIISKGREFTTSDTPNLYIPLLLINKSVFEKIGYFNENMEFTSDCDFSDKAKKAGIDFYYEPEAQIIHEPLNIKSDLRSAFRYGTGRSQKHRSRGIKKKISYFSELNNYFVEGSSNKGFLVGLYLLLWGIFFMGGFVSQEKKYNRIKKQIFFVGGVRGTGKDYCVSNTHNIKKINLYEILKENLDPSWEKTQINICRYLSHLLMIENRLIILLHYSAPVEDIKTDLKSGITRDYSLRLLPSIKKRMISGLPKKNCDYVLIYIKSNLKDIENRLSVRNKKVSNDFVNNIVYISESDFRAYRQTYRLFKSLNLPVRSKIFFNNRKIIKKEIAKFIKNE
jgi:hypothetical protein